MANSSISNILKVRNIVSKNSNIKYTLNQYYFDQIDTEEKAYFLGFLYADGCNIEKKGTVILKLQECDKYIIEKFNIAIESNRNLYFKNMQSKNINWKNQYSLELCNHYLSKRLAELGCFQRKSLTLKFPTEEQVPNHLIQHFIRGYFDGDGSISYAKSSKSYVCSLTSTLDFCEACLKCILKESNISFNLAQPITAKERKTSTMILRIGGNIKTKTFFDWLYKDSTIFLERKYQKYQDLVALFHKIHPNM